MFLRLAAETPTLPEVVQSLIAQGDGPFLWPLLPADLTGEERRLLRPLIAESNLNWSVAMYRGQPQRRAAALARELGIPVAAADWGTCFTGEEQRRIDLLRAIDRCILLDDLEIREPDQFRFADAWSPAEASPQADGPAEDPAEGQVEEPAEDPLKIERASRPTNFGFFDAYPEALDRSAEMGRLFDAGFVVPPRFIFPRFEGMDDEQACDHLRSLCLEGIRKRYSLGSEAQIPEHIQERLDYELDIIRAKGFASYFLVVRDIVLQTPRTCGRGSSAASIVSYALGITHVDPIRYRLFFERFLNMGRTDPPDIDVDFPWDERASTLEYVFRRYPGRSAMVADHVTFGPRSSIREPAKAMGMEDEEIGRCIRLWKLGQGHLLPEWLRREAAAIRGIPRYLGTHPGGVVITPGPISDYTHCQISPLGWPVIAWEKDGAEDAGLVKIDILGNRSLAVLRDSMQLINQRHGTDLSWTGLAPLEDDETRHFIEEGHTLGVFYVESPATRQLLRKMRRGDYEKLVIASSIIRPAANSYINEYVRRLHGGQWEPLHPAAEEVLEESCGIMVYQEDVSRVAIAVCGFDAAEADGLRKVLSRKDASLTLESWRQRFHEGGRAGGADDAVLTRLWEMILSFSGYSFCKPHSASYALVSYRLAYIKQRWPVEFYTGVINNGGGYYRRQTYVNAVRRLGWPVLLPDVRRSDINYTVEYEPPGLLLGLGQIHGLSLRTAGRIIAGRRQRSFGGFSDFYLRIRPDVLEMRALILSGALDGLWPEGNRPSMFWELASLRKQEASQAGMGLFVEESRRPMVDDYSPGRKLRHETEVLGLFASVHPMAIFRSRAEALAARHNLSPLIDSRDLFSVAEMRRASCATAGAAPGAAGYAQCRSDREAAGYAQGRSDRGAAGYAQDLKAGAEDLAPGGGLVRIGMRVYIAGYLVSGKEVRTRLKDAMSFVTFEDEYGLFETVFFPDVYQAMAPVLDGSMVFLLEGTVEEEHGAVSIHIANAIPLTRRNIEGGVFPARGYGSVREGGEDDRKAG